MYLKTYLAFLLFLQFSTSDLLWKENVCKTFEDYHHPDENENCYYNPDTTLPSPDLIRKYAGSVEIHELTTDDGYVLNIFRIPRDNPRGTIVMQHSIATDSRLFLGSGNDSLALTLWRSGFDVWLANMRGTKYSQRHVNLTVANPKYWDFSFHEVGFYDVATQIRFISKKTGDSEIIYLGHSLGTTSALVYASLLSEEAKKNVKMFVLVSTVCYFEHTLSPVLRLLPVETYFSRLSPKAVIPVNTDTLFQISRIFLRLFPSGLFIGNQIISYLIGYTPEEADPALLNFDAGLYVNNFPIKMLAHYAQLARSKTHFRLFDYGIYKNLDVYGSEVPPDYPIGNISVPIFMVSSESDSLASVQDADTLYDSLPERLRAGHLKVVGLNHFDFYFGRHRKEVFVDKLLEFLKTLDKE